MKTCPRCGNVTANDNARFCNRCGSSMDASQQSHGTANAGAAMDVPKPKTDDVPKSRPKQNDRPKAVKTKKSKPRNRRRWVLPVVVVCVVAVFVAVLAVSIPTGDKCIPTIVKDDKASKSLKQLQNGIKSTVLPQDIVRGMTLTDIYIKDGYYCYECECDENLINLDALDISLEEENIRANLANQKQHDRNLQWLLEQCRNASLDLAYIYVGNETGTKKIARIAIADL